MVLVIYLGLLMLMYTWKDGSSFQKTTFYVSCILFGVLMIRELMAWGAV